MMTGQLISPARPVFVIGAAAAGAGSRDVGMSSAYLEVNSGSNSNSFGRDRGSGSVVDTNGTLFSFAPNFGSFRPRKTQQQQQIQFIH